MENNLFEEMLEHLLYYAWMAGKDEETLKKIEEHFRKKYGGDKQ